MIPVQGPFVVLHSTDGGRTWRELPQTGRDWEESRTTPAEQPADVRDLFFLDRLRGWLITWGYNDDGTYLYSTMDGGKH